MAALFACTKCHTRHPFEDLSSAEQLCKSCQKKGDTVRCIYCRIEFQADLKNGSNAVCKNCKYYLKIHGKPTACDYCKELSAFTDKKCQRCKYHENKYGPPQQCHRCKNICAFDKGNKDKNLDGKLLCWLCIIAYKKANKHKNNNNNNNNNISPFNNNSNSSFTTTSNNSSIINNNNNNNSSSSLFSSLLNNFNDNSRLTFKEDDNSIKIDFDKTKEEKFPLMKRKKMERSSSFQFKKSSILDLDMSSSEPFSTITQLNEQIETLKKQLSSKDQIILQKDQKITELKAIQFENEKETRLKIQNLQKFHDESVENMKIKIRELQKIANSVKNGRRSTNNNNTNNNKINSFL